MSEFVTAPAVTGTADDDFRAELLSTGDSLSGTDKTVTSSRWIEGWRGFEQQVVSVAATSGSLSGTFRLLYEDQATVPLAVNASAGAVEVYRVCLSFKSYFGCGRLHQSERIRIEGYSRHAAIARSIDRYL